MDPTRADRFATTDAGRRVRSAAAARVQRFAQGLGDKNQGPRRAIHIHTLEQPLAVDRVQRPLRAPVALVQHTSHVPQSVYAVADGRGQRRYAGIVTHIKRHGPHAVERRRLRRVAAARVDRPRRAFMELLDDRRADAAARDR